MGESAGPGPGRQGHSASLSCCRAKDSALRAKDRLEMVEWVPNLITTGCDDKAPDRLIMETLVLLVPDEPGYAKPEGVDPEKAHDYPGDRRGNPDRLSAAPINDLDTHQELPVCLSEPPLGERVVSDYEAENGKAAQEGDAVADQASPDRACCPARQSEDNHTRCDECGVDEDGS